MEILIDRYVQFLRITGAVAKTIVIESLDRAFTRRMLLKYPSFDFVMVDPIFRTLRLNHTLFDIKTLRMEDEIPGFICPEESHEDCYCIQRSSALRHRENPRGHTIPF
jgi:hypothetical protein